MKKTKRIKLKKWVEKTLIIINFILIILLSSDCNNLITFITSKIILLSVIALNTYLLKKYTNLFEL